MTIRSTVPLFLILWVAGAIALPAQSQKFQAEVGSACRGGHCRSEGLGHQGPLGAQSPPRSAVAEIPCGGLPAGDAAEGAAGRQPVSRSRRDDPRGVTVLSNRDGVVLAGAAITGTSYSARVNVGPSEVPGFIRLWAYTPVSHFVAIVPVAFLDAVYRFDLKSANGFMVKAIPAAKTFTIEGTRATLGYQVEFFKPGETKPFETRVGTTSHSVSDNLKSQIEISLSEPASSAAAEYEAITVKLADPKLPPAEQQALAQRMVKAQQRMMDEMMKAGADPAAEQKKVDDFGCFRLVVQPGEGGAVRGTVTCGKNFNKGNLEVTGTMGR